MLIFNHWFKYLKPIFQKKSRSVKVPALIFNWAAEFQGFEYGTVLSVTFSECASHINRARENSRCTFNQISGPSVSARREAD